MTISWCSLRLALLRFVALPFLATVALGIALPRASLAASCDRQCLLRVMAGYLKSMQAHTAGEIPVVHGAVVRENTMAIALSDSKWNSVASIQSTAMFADAITGNVVSRVGALEADNKPVYISTRLKIIGKNIVEVDTSFDDSPRVVANIVANYDPLFDTLVPREKRASRASLERIVKSYFQALGDHKPLAADFDERCDRFHSGLRITHNPNNGIEGMGDANCKDSASGNPPWGPAIEQRIPIIDPERGIVVAYTLLLYPNDKEMYVSEVFKILNGKIRLIDNIGIMGSGINTTGFKQ